ncbi:Cytochrome c556 [Salinihabitans flavidus]|uniref:Cytochrome c556 n=1 Tax=Salinihabitans flavidus TaxID=569882 RepID=A0A1H8NJU0_9RHOB|nr:cytochrome c [Salinihabitans flavidus]SEO29880.1 Cytochrome c556 [Salinihabitans flavidus]
MKRIFATTALAVALSFGAGISTAQDAAIEARQNLMQLQAFNLGQLGAMAKGEMPYDAEQAQVAADNLVALARLDQSAMWPEGSDSFATDKTRAKPAIWDNFSDLMEKDQALVEAAVAMQEIAGTDLDALRGRMEQVGKACGACHEDYREPKN